MCPSSRRDPGWSSNTGLCADVLDSQMLAQTGRASNAQSPRVPAGPVPITEPRTGHAGTPQHIFTEYLRNMHYRKLFLLFLEFIT